MYRPLSFFIKCNSCPNLITPIHCVSNLGCFLRLSSGVNQSLSKQRCDYDKLDAHFTQTLLTLDSSYTSGVRENNTFDIETTILYFQIT